jgi:hypothetical protein
MFGLLDDIVKIAVAPISIATDVARVVTKPVADIAEEICKEAKDLTK